MSTRPSYLVTISISFSCVTYAFKEERAREGERARQIRTEGGRRCSHVIPDSLIGFVVSPFDATLSVCRLRLASSSDVWPHMVRLTFWGVFFVRPVSFYSNSVIIPGLSHRRLLPQGVVVSKSFLLFHFLGKITVGDDNHENRN